MPASRQSSLGPPGIRHGFLALAILILLHYYNPVTPSWVPSFSAMVRKHTREGRDLYTLEHVQTALAETATGTNDAFFSEKMWYDCEALFAHVRNRVIRDPYVNEFYVIVSLAACGYEGGFIRYGDGEMAFIHNRAIPASSQLTIVDHVSPWDAPGRSLLGARVEQTLREPHPAIFYAISCTKCPASINHVITPYLRQAEGMWSYSVLFHNTNYGSFSSWLKLLARGQREVLAGRDVILVVNEEARQRSVELAWADAIVYFPDEVVKRYEEDGDDLLAPLLEAARTQKGAIFLISGGPLAKWAVYLLYSTNPQNFYIDVGSAMDVTVKGRVTRPFHTTSGGHVCGQT